MSDSGKTVLEEAHLLAFVYVGYPEQLYLPEREGSARPHITRWGWPED